jgi:hypothetical protein
MRWLLAIFLAFLILLVVVAQGQTPTPSPYTISDAELAKIPASDIAKTAHHLVELYQDEHKQLLELQANLAAATASITATVSDTTNGLAHVTSLQQGIDVLAAHDKSETDRANKLDKALWWYRLHWWGAWIMLGLGIAACGLLAFLKFTGRLSLSAAKVAAKL